MSRLALAAALILGAGAGWAEPTNRGTGAVLRVLDKLSGDVRDVELDNGGGAPVGRLLLELGECRYPEENPAGDAYAYVMVRDTEAETVFSGWMIASSPALSALDHPRYDVWVIRCKTA
ncbi:DUF2155 domain-containing protein [Lutimaribacter sp. EGI FJ00015]|uniref:DUF2155 domain-containing protein n=1 Tax=Lutimaribacter degradans TaxID=2945989 RepID=A0ACC5ZRH7_9RHOB|nr:DUF2155 domain-containing protein [Lutimaribacter sp. EGI FJ00013]MCM2560891.1 DUF2155 domain-containing protein [Lutimaribacter sp. EGI FJ00013]MCO0612164.1 DUF2155 domain-containing protein [Lutimaribacter sp. EGI FJ00015]MCO0634716.1 DUF2155 domain-containing protein [Lutimaribacter sp. EGI FJ00014]